MPGFLQIILGGSLTPVGEVGLPGPGVQSAGPDLQWDPRTEVKRDEISERNAGLPLEPSRASLWPRQEWKMGPQTPQW